MTEKYILFTIETYRDLNIVWLLTGDGEMIHKEDSLLVSEPNVQYETTPKVENVEEKDTNNFMYNIMKIKDDRIEQLVAELTLLKQEIYTIKAHTHKD